MRGIRAVALVVFALVIGLLALIGVLETLIMADEITQIRAQHGCIGSPSRFASEFFAKVEAPPPSAADVFFTFGVWALHCTPLTAPDTERAGIPARFLHLPAGEYD